MTQSGSDYKVPVAIIVGAVIVGMAIFFSSNYKLQIQPVDEPTLSPTTAPTAGPTLRLSPTIEQKPSGTTAPTVTRQPTSPTPTDEMVFKSLLVQKTGINENDIEISVSENNHQVARGGVKDKNAVGGAMWFAAKDSTGWQVTYVGQGVPECDEVNPYGYPTAWADYCIDEHGNTVSR